MRDGFVKAIGPDGKTREVPAHYLTNPRFRFRSPEADERTVADPPSDDVEPDERTVADPPSEGDEPEEPTWADAPDENEE